MSAAGTTEEPPAGPGASAASDRGRLPKGRVALVIELALGLAYLLLRWWRTTGVYPMVFQDSLKLLESAETYGWLSRNMWAGWRSPMTPLLYKVAGATTRVWQPAINLHILLGAIAWFLLAVTVGRRLPGVWRWVGMVLILLTGLTTPIAMWDHVILTESLSITLFLFPVVAGIRLAERHTWGRVAVFLATMVPLALIRDIHLVFTGPLGLAALVIGIVAVVRRRGPLAGMAFTCVVVLLGLALFMRWSTTTGERDIQATRETLFVKILPYEDRFEWFASHGMPDADRLRELRANIALDPQTGAPLFPLPQYNDPAWPELSRWFKDEGQATYYKWLATHPFDALNDWFVRPKLIWNSAGDSWAFYRNVDFERGGGWAVLDWLLFPPMVVLAGVTTVAVAFLQERRRRWWAGPVGLVAVVVLATGLVHGVLSWLGDPAEVSRHAMLAIVQLRLGCLMLIVLALPEAAAAVRNAPPEEEPARVEALTGQ